MDRREILEILGQLDRVVLWVHLETEGLRVPLVTPEVPEVQDSVVSKGSLVKLDHLAHSETQEE